MAKFGKELAVRTLTGAALLLIVTGAVFVSEYGFVALLLTICVGSMWEFYRMAARKEIRIERMYPVVVGAVGVAMMSGMEMQQLRRGIAVKIRHKLK